MRLTSADGPAIDLSPVAYEFPERRGDGSGRDFDANWLMIRGRVVAGDLSWTFTDPCLTTTEARGVGSWLREIVRGVAGPEAPWTTEPNVRFSLVERTDSLATVRVAFSQESSPPGSNEDIQFGAGYPVDVVLSLTDLLTAANEWDHELERLPVR